MAHRQEKVPFGYEPPKASRRGCLFVLETFEDWTEEEVGALAAWAVERKFARVVLYPQHEETLRRMGIACASPYYSRVKLLEAAIAACSASIPVELDQWEGKRKKYTPLDTSLRFLTEKHHGPFFLALSDRYANLFVTYPSFQDWIKELRLFIIPRFQVPLHPQLEAWSHRWELAEPGAPSLS